MEKFTKLINDYSPYVDKKLEILTLSEDWQRKMDLGHYVIEHTFLDILHPEDESIIAETQTNWQYREANIRWYLDKVVTLHPKNIERTIVHELTHIFLAPVEQHLKPNKEEYLELAVESLARAFMEMRYGTV